MPGIEMVEQPPQEVEVDEMFSFTFHCPFTTRTLSNEIKRFTLMNSFATAKLVDMDTQENHEDDTYILGRPQAQFSTDTQDRILRFNMGIRIPGSYKILIAMHGKTSDPKTALHYSVLAEVWTEEIIVTEPICYGLPAGRSSDLIVEDGLENLSQKSTQIIENGLPFAYYRILMQAPLTSYQRTFLVQAMAAVTDANRTKPEEEPDDSTDDDDDEGGVPLSRGQLEDCGVIGPAGAYLRLNGRVGQCRA